MIVCLIAVAAVFWMPNPGGREPRDFLLRAAHKKPDRHTSGFLDQ